MYGFCVWRLLPPFPTVSFVRSKIVRMTCRTKLGLLDRVTHAVRDHSSDMNILRVYDWSKQNSVQKMIRPKDVIGRDESPSEG